MLTSPAQHTAGFRVALREILPAICNQQGVAESSALFRRYHREFSGLRGEGFIVNRFNPARGGVLWHLSENVVSVLQRLEEKEDVLPSEALSVLFTDSQAARPREAASVYGAALHQMHDLAQRWRSSWDEVAGLVAASELKVREVQGLLERPGEEQAAVYVGHISASVRDLVDAVLATSETQADNGGIERRSAFLSLWCAPENCDEICDLLSPNISALTSRASLFGLMHRHVTVLNTLLDLLDDLVSGEGIVPLRGRLLSQEDLRILHAARTLFLGQEYPEAADAINDGAERKIRDVVFLRLKCLGPEDLIQLLPGGAKQEVLRAGTRGPIRTRRRADRNFLYDVSRGSYPEILLEERLRRAIFGRDLSAEEIASLKRRLSDLFGLGTREAHTDRPSYFKDHGPAIREALSTAADTFELLNHALADLTEDGSLTLEVQQNGLAYQFRSPVCTGQRRLIPSEDVDGVLTSLLERLTRDPIESPPIETALLGLDEKAEHSLVVLMGAIKRTFAVRKLNRSPFAIQFEMTDLGSNRASKLTPRAS